MAMRARNRMLVLLMASTTVLSGCATIGEWLSVDFQMKHEHIHHERCDLKPEGGLCKAAFKKYYFNHNRSGASLLFGVGARVLCLLKPSRAVSLHVNRMGLHTVTFW